MVHFVTNLQHYIMVEVMQTSWAKLSQKLPESADLDSVISAHSEFVVVVFVFVVVIAAIVATPTLACRRPHRSTASTPG